MTTINVLKEAILKANQAYRAGTPIISDFAYDNLCESLHKLVLESDPSPREAANYYEFLNSLTEKAGDVKQDYVIGSLKKVKIDDGTLLKWLVAKKPDDILVQAKVDGMSFVAKYSNGKPVKALTRGDGKTGEDILDKCLHILPTINPGSDVYIRGELTLTGDSHLELGFKNRRNGTVGTMKREGVAPEKLKHVKAIVYQIMNSGKCRFSQLQELDDLGFTTPYYDVVEVTKNMEEPLLRTLDYCRTALDYDIDGLVICDLEYSSENQMFPDNIVAFKSVGDSAITDVVGIEWNVSKAGLLKPTVLISPVELEGSTISRVTGNNYQWLEERGIAPGAKIKIIRSGQVIPKIIEVVEPAITSIVASCPSCGGTVTRNGVDLCCVSKSCSGTVLQQVFSFLCKYEVEGVSEISLENWGITDFQKLLDFSPSKLSLNQINFFEELQAKVFTNTTMEQIMSRLYWNGAGERNFNKILNKFGDLWSTMEAIRHPEKVKELPEGIGVLTLQKMSANLDDNWDIANLIGSDKRIKHTEKKEEVAMSNTLNGKTFLITGKMEIGTRPVMQEKISANGGVNASSVTKNLDYLICGGDSWGSSSKYTKAEKLGVKIISEKEFFEMIGE